VVAVLLLLLLLLLLFMVRNVQIRKWSIMRCNGVLAKFH